MIVKGMRGFTLAQLTAVQYPYNEIRNSFECDAGHVCSLKMITGASLPSFRSLSADLPRAQTALPGYRIA